MGSEAKEMVRRAGRSLESDSKSGFCAMSLRCIRGLLFVLFSNAGVLLRRYGTETTCMAMYSCSEQ